MIVESMNNIEQINIQYHVTINIYPFRKHKILFK